MPTREDTLELVENFASMDKQEIIDLISLCMTDFLDESDLIQLLKPIRIMIRRGIPARDVRYGTNNKDHKHAKVQDRQT